MPSDEWFKRRQGQANQSSVDKAVEQGLQELRPITADARGRVLQEDDEIILNIRGPIYFRVAKIAPAPAQLSLPGMDPRMSELYKSQVLVHVGCMLTFTATREQANAEFIRVRTAEEAGPSTFKLMDAVDTGRKMSDS